MADPLLQRLAAHRLLGSVPAEERAWVAEHGELRHLAVGDHLSSPELGPIRQLYIVLSGRITMFLDRPRGPRKVVEWRGGDVTGLLPYSRLGTSPGVGRADEPTEILAVDGADFPEMIRECPELTAKLVQQMLDRARLFTRSDLQEEKMASLGRLAAGLAHELDNPASAVIRGANLLVSLLIEADAAARAMGETGLADDAREAAEAVRDECLAVRVHEIRSPLEQARREEEIADWLEARGVDAGGAEALADTPVTVQMLDTLADAVPESLLDPVLRWVATGCTVRGLASEIAEAATRMSELVRAVKGFTQVDSGSTLKPVDIAPGIAQTLAVLRAKARAKSASVSMRMNPDLPAVMAVSGELNQIWVNLIDNALDAVAPGGTVEIAAMQEGDSVIVRVVDDGPGIPVELQQRIFEPFFTTKAVGDGTGLGLDIVRKLAANQGGRVELSSVPGRTEFRVILPTDDAEAAASAARARLPEGESK